MGQGHEIHQAGILRAEPEGTARVHAPQVVRPDGHQRAVPAQVPVELVLQVDERIVPLRRERHAPEDAADHVRTDGGRGRAVHDHRVGAGDAPHHGGLDVVAREDAEGAGEALDAQQVVPVGGEVDFVHHLRGPGGQLHRVRHGARRERFLVFLPFRRHVVQFDAVFEAQLVEFLVTIITAQGRVQQGALYAQGRHGGNTM
mmetsp:Transcript_6650/g.13855  ORF Transcript_6650/g.13855 Transcript_6650/m.13855 type:complete len:201 (+) Transcript_6650:942-1544(+)